MADKGWTAQAGAAAGIAAGAAAAQLGLGYGLGVIAWPATVTASDSTWLSSLGWATWITASATVLGAVLAGRLRADRSGRWQALRRFALAAAAALGALVSVALVALPARSAVRTDTLSPQLVAVGYALIGLVTGVVVAFWAISSGPAAANLLGTAAWLWALAVAGVVAELATGRDVATYLTSWQFAEADNPIRYGGIYWPSAALTLVAAFVIGLLLAWPATRRGDLGLGAATSGAVGPLLVAVSFLALAPLLTEAAGALPSAYLIAPYAVLAGLAGSALTVSLARARRDRHGSGGPAPAPPPGGPAAAGAPASETSGPSQDPAAAAAPAPSAPATTTPAASTPAAKAPAPKADPAAAAKAGPAAAKADPAAAPGTGGPTAAVSGGSGAPPRTGDTEAAAPPVAADPEIAAAARRGRNPAKRAAARKDSATRSTITPPPANPTVARINPPD
ncbi:Hansenula MRAKII killer toxin-resistant protein 1 [Actinoplanes teichomyceticus]|uniref:Uncharacterized protein n=1 Tax=Actinoplanes teichomyceticus TaxID=1867 RepID=A0A561WRK8_ACTTI|nr:Hansenula MRAKII killer toxin-resistant protein 1 [Actinoplanes teichomyceticus]TWG26484.1 hypothetical protein FHX34_1011470 [Actinoplanes teichomyceticus]GIF11562.1 hypothetical protein Ate01nite_15940 [Actinoplanes teichomyceticus]